LLSIQIHGNSQTCNINNSVSTFADVQALEAYLAAEFAGMTCTEIILRNGITIDCASMPTSLNFTGPFIDKIVNFGSLRIDGCSSVQTIDGFQQAVSGFIIIQNNDVLTAISGFPQLINLNGIVISNNPELITIDEFPLVSGNNGSISISNNPKLITFPGYSRIKCTNVISIRDNEALTNIGDYSNLLNSGNISIINNNSLLSIDAFHSLSFISGELEIRLNDKLNSISGFSNIKQQRSNGIEISDNPELNTISEFTHLEYLNDLHIYNNPALVNMGDFPSLTRVDWFWMINNNSLITLGDFPQLSTVDRGFFIRNNLNLTNIGDFSQLCEVNFFPSGDAVLITGNPNLSVSTCCTFSHLFEFGTINGDIDISNNGVNCTEADILNCPSSPVSSSCITNDVDIFLNACGEAYINKCEFIEGPCCEYEVTFTINNFGYNLGTYVLDEFDVGSYPVTMDNGVDPPCAITLTVHSACEDNLTISGSIASNLYEASNTITSDGTVTSGPVDFSAGVSVNLEPDFEVYNGQVFHAFIDGCGN